MPINARRTTGQAHPLTLDALHRDERVSDGHTPKVICDYDIPVLIADLLSIKLHCSGPCDLYKVRIGSPHFNTHYLHLEVACAIQHISDSEHPSKHKSLHVPVCFVRLYARRLRHSFRTFCRLVLIPQPMVAALHAAVVPQAGSFTGYSHAPNRHCSASLPSRRLCCSFRRWAPSVMCRSMELLCTSIAR